jgi:uncharacterized protein YbaR (Trm112 family)/SAM-dependent methyltransferase
VIQAWAKEVQPPVDLESQQWISACLAMRLLSCPRCKAVFHSFNDRSYIRCELCRSTYPIVDDIPILLDSESSIFNINEIIQNRNRRTKYSSRTMERISQILPNISKNIVAEQNYNTLKNMLVKEHDKPLVLVIGGRIVGQGMQSFLDSNGIDFIETDVGFGPRTRVICDARDLPFSDQRFDAVIAQAVLEHVADPVRCVDEIHRVLKDDGLVYAETPFMQQVHAGAYDFTRFTHLGHRRLFRKFDEIVSGTVGGPATVLAWSYEYFFLSFATSRLWRKALAAFARCTGFWLKYLDRLFVNKPGAYDGVSGNYFLGRKASHVLSDQELIKLYRGGM